jgi:hypothetical protein
LTVAIKNLRRKFFLPSRFLKKLPGKILRLLTFVTHSIFNLCNGDKMKITRRHLRQIIQEEIYRLQEQDSVGGVDFAVDEKTKMMFNLQIRSYLRGRSDFIGYIPYTKDAEIELKAMFGTGNTRVNIEWDVDANAYAKIASLGNLQGKISLRSATGEGTTYVRQAVDLVKVAGERTGGTITRSDPNDVKFVSSAVRRPVQIPVTGVWSTVDTTGVGMSSRNAPPNAKSILINVKVIAASSSANDIVSKFPR